MTEEEARVLAKKLLDEMKKNNGVFASMEERKAHTFQWVGMIPLNKRTKIGAIPNSMEAEDDTEVKEESHNEPRE